MAEIEALTMKEGESRIVTCAFETSVKMIIMRAKNRVRRGCDYLWASVYAKKGGIHV